MELGLEAFFIIASYHQQTITKFVIQKLTGRVTHGEIPFQIILVLEGREIAYKSTRVSKGVLHLKIHTFVLVLEMLNEWYFALGGILIVLWWN